MMKLLLSAIALSALMSTASFAEPVKTTVVPTELGSIQTDQLGGHPWFVICDKCA